MSIDLLTAVPVLRATEIEKATSFYCERLGFSRDWLYRPHEELVDPSYMGISRGDVRLHVSSFSGDGVFGAVVMLYVSDIDALFGELRSRGVEIDLEPIDQTWGAREMYLRDQDGNRLRFVQAQRD